MKKLKFPIFIIELIILTLMLLTLFIQSDLIPIIPWNEIAYPLLIRSIIWLFGLSIFPGVYLLRLLKILENQSIMTKIVIGINLSFVLVGLVTLYSYYTSTLRFLPVFLLGTLIISGSIYWLNHKFKPLKIEANLSKSMLLLVVVIITSIIIAFSVQAAQRYLIRGDNWSGLLPSIQIINQRNIYSSFSRYKYPLMFGFVLAGLSICSGLPVVNTYVALFPIVALNILTFFVLLRIVFNFEEKVSVMASMIYALTGGLGWIIQTFFYHDSINFWKLSDLTQDMYFSFLLWNNIQFSYKSLALTLAYTSIITFIISIRFRNSSRKFVMLILASLSISFSYFIHMIETIIFLPIIYIISFIYEENHEGYKTLGYFTLITSIIFLIIDFSTSGYYSWITINKLNEVLFPNINYIYFTLFISLIPLIIISIYLYKNNLRIYVSDFLDRNKIYTPLKSFIILLLISIYICGPYFWIKAPQNIFVYQLNPIPWYYYTTRYGLMGLLALIGLGLTKWNTKWFKVASSFILLILLIGNIFWSSRITTYLHPMVAIFAAIGLNGILENSNTNILMIIKVSSLKSTNRILKFNLKLIKVILMIPVILLSTSSLIYLASHYIHNNYSIVDNEAKVFLWINQNTPQNATILVPNIYKIYKGVETISDREIYISTNLPSIDSDLIKSLGNYNIKYAILFENEVSVSLKLLLQRSKLEFEMGNINVFKLPNFKNPTREK